MDRTSITTGFSFFYLFRIGFRVLRLLFFLLLDGVRIFIKLIRDVDIPSRVKEIVKEAQNGAKRN